MTGLRRGRPADDKKESGDKKMSAARQLPPLGLRDIKPIGECVYCGSTSDLRREHVVPRGMQGEVTLPQGSCGTCADLTKDIETHCLRHTLIHVRMQLGLHNHPNELPETFPVKLTDWSDNESTLQVPIADFPTIWAMPIYDYPGILRGVTQEEASGGVIAYAHKHDANFQKLLALPNVKSVSATTGALSVDLFTRFIAKIAYCYAVAGFGLNAVKSSPLVDLIRNSSPQSNYFVGGLNNLKMDAQPQPTFELEPATNEIFRVEMRKVPDQSGDLFWAVYVRLLPNLSGASYLAIVGRAER
jgi:hypothetical protein